MSEIEQARVSWPAWLRWSLSIAIVLHLGAVFNGALSAPSGPWPTAEGMDMATPPVFAQAIGGIVSPYLDATKLHHNYHFAENRVNNQLGPGTACWFEVKLKDKDGKEIKTLRFPDPEARGSIQHFQALMADGLNQDEPVEPFSGERIPAPDQPVNTVRYWQMGEGRIGSIVTTPEHLVPRDQQVYGPSEWSMILARSFSRFLCRENGAASAEIIRHSKPYIPPDVLFEESVPSAAFEEMTMNFGVFHAQ